jgi:hypothetical protein
MGTRQHLARSAVHASLIALALVACADDKVTAPIAANDAKNVKTSGAVQFTVNTANRYAISRFIYGANWTTDTDAWGNASTPNEFTLNRLGGNRTTAYNWENNYSNAGADWQYQNDNSLSSSTVPGEAIRSRATATFSRGAGLMVTVPMLGYVAADGNGPMDTLDADRAQRLASRFRISKPVKGSAFTLTPDPNDGYVYQDEFVNWVDKTFPAARSDLAKPIFFSLDNEPDIWSSTHREIQSNIGDDPNQPRLQTYTGFINTTIAYARGIKSVVPGALVFGPAVATYAGVVTLGRYPTPDPVYGTQSFTDVFLDQMRQAEVTYGKRLVDAYDLHWYPAAGTSAGEITNDYATQDAAMINARLQAPRSLWDPTYNEQSWANDVTGGPVQLLPRLRQEIAAHYPGTKIAITEYYYGRGGDISGGIAQADVLGIFGREGVFAATLWPNAGLWASPYAGSGAKAYAYIFGALRMFRNYDGQGGAFGDLGVSATTSDAVNSSVYASLDAAQRVVVIAINKKAVAQTATITVAHPVALHTAHVYTLTGASASPVQRTDIAVGANNTLSYSMPAMSVSTLVLTP